MKDNRFSSSEFKLLQVLISYSSRYEISVQFWPDYVTVYIAKDGVDLQSYGGEGAIARSVEYLDRINPTSNA